MDLHLKGKVAAVTGGSRGIGRRIVQRFAEEGCDVAFCARNEAELERAADEVRQLGVRVFTAVVDITDPEGARAFIDGAGPFHSTSNIFLQEVHS